MSAESLIIAVVIIAIVWFVIQKLVPAEFKQIAVWIFIAAVAIWVITHIHALLSCCGLN